MSLNFDFMNWKLDSEKINKLRAKVLIYLYILTLISPFIGTILLSRDADCIILILFPIYFISVGTSAFIYTELVRFETKKKRLTYLLIGLSSATIFFMTYSFQLELSDYFLIQRKNKELIVMVEKIKNSNITIMTSNYENLNGYTIKRKFFPGKEHPLDSILSLFKIDKQKYNDLRLLLKSVGCCGLSVTDGIIYFEQGGILDNRYGFAYSPTGWEPYENSCGMIIKWRKITGNWYSWATT